MDKAELQKRIVSAFADVPYPGDDRLGDPDGRDDGEDVTEGFRGKDWRSLKPDELWPDALFWMTPEAYHYYFPAYLLAAMKGNAGDIFDSVLVHLTPPLDTDNAADNFHERHNSFTAAQKQVVRDFLDLVLEEIIAHRTKRQIFRYSEERRLRALLDYWSRF